MKVNEGNVDRFVRAFVGLVLIALAMTSIIGPWGWIGIVPLVTGAVGMCPLYSLVGFSTCDATPP
jgi:hypothetical protein